MVGQNWGSFARQWLLLDQVRERMDFVQTVDAVRAMCATHPRAHVKLVEDAANGPAIMSQLGEEIGGFEEVQPLGGKEARANAASQPIRAGYVYLPHPDVFPWVKAFLFEVCLFPKGEHDDQLDAMTQFLNHVGRDRTRKTRVLGWM